MPATMLTTPTGHIVKVDRRVSETLSTTSTTTVRSKLRPLHVYAGARHPGELDQRIVETRLVFAAPANQIPRRESGRLLTTVLMTDIVDSTRTAARLGDRRWRELLADHYADCRTQVEAAGGELLSTTGDGIVASFDAPSLAVRAAIAIQAVARASGIAVRAGVHTGECELMRDGLAGVAVHIAARICALGTANEVMTTATVRDLVIGSLLAFEPRGRHQLKGVPGDWTVFRATDSASESRGGRS